MSRRRSSWAKVPTEIAALLPKHGKWTDAEIALSISLKHHHAEPVAMRGLMKLYGVGDYKLKRILDSLSMTIIYPEGYKAKRGDREGILAQQNQDANQDSNQDAIKTENDLFSGHLTEPVKTQSRQQSRQSSRRSNRIELEPKGPNSCRAKVSRPDIRKIIDHLNAVTGKNFSPTTGKTVRTITARVNEGFKEEDFITVIDNQFAAWGEDDQMSQYLRPETLFGNKFDGYLNNAPANPADKTTPSWL